MDRVQEIDVRNAASAVAMGAVFDFHPDSIHTRGKYGMTDTTMIGILEKELEGQEIKGLFICPKDWPVPSSYLGSAGQELGTYTRSIIFEITLIVEYNDERDRDAPIGEPVSSHDYFTRKVDLLIEQFDLNVGLGWEQGEVMHAGLGTARPLYDHPVEDLGVFHIARFVLEARVIVPVFLCQH